MSKVYYLKQSRSLLQVTTYFVRITVYMNTKRKTPLSAYISTYNCGTSTLLCKYWTENYISDAVSYTQQKAHNSDEAKELS